MNKTLNLIGKPEKLSAFLLVWQGGNSEYFCEFVNGKDYETAEYAILQMLPKTGINNTNKQHVFRVYIPLAFYNGNKYKLSRVRECFTAPIEIWRNEKSHWQAEFIKILSLEWDEMKTAIYTNFDRIYGRK